MKSSEDLIKELEAKTDRTVEEDNFLFMLRELLCAEWAVIPSPRLLKAPSKQHVTIGKRGENQVTSGSIPAKVSFLPEEMAAFDAELEFLLEGADFHIPEDVEEILFAPEIPPPPRYEAPPWNADDMARFAAQSERNRHYLEIQSDKQKNAPVRTPTVVNRFPFYITPALDKPGVVEMSPQPGAAGWLYMRRLFPDQNVLEIDTKTKTRPTGHIQFEYDASGLRDMQMMCGNLVEFDTEAYQKVEITVQAGAYVPLIVIKLERNPRVKNVRTVLVSSADTE